MLNSSVATLTPLLGRTEIKININKAVKKIKLGHPRKSRSYHEIFVDLNEEQSGYEKARKEQGLYNA